jgi:hypothetical protein
LAIFYLNIAKTLKFLLDKLYTNGANFGSKDKNLNKELLVLSEHLNNLTNNANQKNLKKSNTKKQFTKS